MKPPRTAFSLLEVVLALAILAGAIAVLGEAARQAMRNAAASRDYCRAQLLCESKMAEIVAGISLPEAVQNASFEAISEDETGWLYSIAVDPIDPEAGLIAVRVTVTPDQPPENHPVSFALKRWMIDPSFTPATTASSSATSSATTSSATTSSAPISP